MCTYMCMYVHTHVYIYVHVGTYMCICACGSSHRNHSRASAHGGQRGRGPTGVGPPEKLRIMRPTTGANGGRPTETIPEARDQRRGPTGKGTHGGRATKKMTPQIGFPCLLFILSHYIKDSLCRACQVAECIWRAFVPYCFFAPASARPSSCSSAACSSASTSLSLPSPASIAPSCPGCVASFTLAGLL